MDNKFKKFKQILAILAVALILLLYVITLVLSLMNNSYTHKFFNASLFATFFIPIMIYLIIWIAKVFRSYNPNDESNQNIHKKHDK